MCIAIFLKKKEVKFVLSPKSVGGGGNVHMVNTFNSYAQVVVDSLSKRFHDLHVLNVSQLFSPKYYPIDEEVRITMSEQWLERLIIKFG